MKLSGNKKNGHYTPGSRRGQTPQQSRGRIEKNADLRAADAATATKTKRSIRFGKILIVVLAIILVILVVFYIVLRMGLTPPEVNLVPKPVDGDNPAGAAVELTEPAIRDKTKFTFAIFGMDNGFGNTDTIMVATFDDKNYTLNVVNIPRDTLVNVSWSTKKVNSLYANGGIERAIEGLTEILGYKVDFYVKVDLDAFSKLVNGIGGVDFDVPKDIYYKDATQDLLIDLKAGPQLLDGPHALQLVRARKNVWSTGDIGRISTQQDFLKAAAEQILEKKASIKVSALIDIFVNDVETNITALNMGWLAQEFFKMDAANINFETLPANYYDEVNNDSYCTIKVSDWLNVINTKLNPFDFKVTAEDLSILTRGSDGKLFVTNGIWAGKKSWGAGGSSSSTAGVESSPDPSEKPGESPSPSPSDEPSPSPSEDSSPEPSPTEPVIDVSPSPSPDSSPEPSPTEN